MLIRFCKTDKEVNKKINIRKTNAEFQQVSEDNIQNDIIFIKL